MNMYIYIFHRRLILPTDALSFQPTPYPSNRRPILPTDKWSHCSDGRWSHPPRPSSVCTYMYIYIYMYVYVCVYI